MRKEPLVKRLNWLGFWFMLPLTFLGVGLNKSINNIVHGLIIGSVLWLVFGGLFLILGKKDS